MSRLGFVQRSFVSAMRALTKASAGYDMGPIQEEMVRIHGMRGTLRLMKLGADVTSTLAGAVGDYTAQTLIGIAALWNGCRYCVIGHIYSANLHLYEKTGKIGPLDEESLIDLMYMTDDESFEALREAFLGSEDAELPAVVTNVVVEVDVEHKEAQHLGIKMQRVAEDNEVEHQGVEHQEVRYLVTR